MCSQRPSCLDYPIVWSTFESKGQRFEIKDLTENFYEEAVETLKEHFVNDEPPCRFIGLRNHPDALEELVNLWKKTLSDKLSLGCFAENSTTLIAVNVLTIAHKGDNDKFETPVAVWRSLFGAVELVANSVDVYKMFNVNEFLNAYGLVVKPEYRGLNIGVEMLKARIPLCKSLGLRMTATVFTAIASQKCAEKAGFKTVSEITYEEMAKNHGFVFPNIEKHTISSKLMVLLIV